MEDSIHIIPRYHDVFAALEKLLSNHAPILLAIDGRCGSGKSTLAEILQKEFDCHVIHMDDFFLPFEMKTKERLSQPGGNVHIERFLTDVVEPLKRHETFSYRPYQCSDGTFGDPIYVKRKELIIIEGVYSMHPALQLAYDYKVFLTIDIHTQQKRILERNGQEMLKRFLNQWIPMEEVYFSAFAIEAKCDAIINTSHFK